MLSAICDEVATTHEPVTVTRRGKPLVRIDPIDEPVMTIRERRAVYIDEFGEFDQQAAKTYSELAIELRKAERPKPVMDLLIAATAKQHGLIIATLNAQDFEGIPGLRVEDWA